MKQIKAKVSGFMPKRTGAKSLFSKGILGSCLSASLLFPTTGFSSEEQVWITIDQDAEAALQQVHARSIAIPRSIANLPHTNPNVMIAKVDADQVSTLSSYMHQHHQRCGGFVTHSSLADALRSVQAPIQPRFASTLQPSFKHQDEVDTLTQQLSESRILDFIASLADFKNRYYSSKSGEEAAHFIRDSWKNMIGERTDATVQLFKHSWRQPSVVMTLTGTEHPDEIIVIGGHLDSINQWMPSWGTAPGADDDASGIATLTEVARAFLSSNIRPKRTIQFMGYAAEEVGLRGSKDIASQYRASNQDVKAVIQLDMTNYQGSNEDIVFMSDYTDRNLTEMAEKVLDTYFPEINYSRDKCGYACSDHASWTQNRYPAIMPFEARKRDMNPHIHTSRDTVDKSGHSAAHAMKFAKLASAFALEMANAR